jgi:hypothetical protein
VPDIDWQRVAVRTYLGGGTQRLLTDDEKAALNTAIDQYRQAAAERQEALTNWGSE